MGERGGVLGGRGAWGGNLRIVDSVGGVGGEVGSELENIAVSENR